MKDTKREIQQEVQQEIQQEVQNLEKKRKLESERNSNIHKFFVQNKNCDCVNKNDLDQLENKLVNIITNIQKNGQRENSEILSKKLYEFLNALQFNKQFNEMYSKWELFSKNIYETFKFNLNNTNSKQLNEYNIDTLNSKLLNSIKRIFDEYASNTNKYLSSILFQFYKSI